MTTPTASVRALANEPVAGPEPQVMRQVWDSPAYDALNRHQLMRNDWLIESYADLSVKMGNASAEMKCIYQCICCLNPWLKVAEVPSGTVRLTEDGRGGFAFLGNSGPLQGIHVYWDLFLRLGKSVAVNAPEGDGRVVIKNGDHWIVVVPQGFIGLAEDMGQPVLLPPGMHQWSSATMRFSTCVDLTQPVIHLGPYTLLTVDKGYEAVTQNNGQQEVLPGGAVHLLLHRNHKFEKFISRKIQTDDLKRLEVMTGDNVLMLVEGTVCWQIQDVTLCAEMAAETMHQTNPAGSSREVHVGHDGKILNSSTGTIKKLREDVLKQADASLSALVGKVNFSDTFAPATLMQQSSPPGPSVMGSAVKVSAPAVTDVAVVDASMLFNIDKLKDAVTHANDMTRRYGVEILSINIISAKPENSDLMQSLAKGAVAAAEAQQLEITARGQAKATAILARGDADAEVTRAEGARAAAELLNKEKVAVQLAYISTTGEAMAKAKASLILGSNPSAIGAMLLQKAAGDDTLNP